MSDSSYLIKRLDLNSNEIEEEKYLKLIKYILNIYSFQKEDLPLLISFLQNLKEEKNFKFNNEFKVNRLTQKEKEILKLVVSGKTTKQIARELFIQPVTVSTHRKKIGQKLGTRSILEWNFFYEMYKYTYF